MSIEAMKLALEALEAYRPVIVKRHGLTYSVGDKAITALRQAIEQAHKQEPYGYLKLNTGRFVNEVEGLNPMTDKRYLPLYTSPPVASNYTSQHRVDETAKQEHEQAQKQEPDAVQAMIDWYNSGNEDWEEFSRLLSMLTSPPSNSMNSIKSDKTSDAPRQPLTDEELRAVIQAKHITPTFTYRLIARAIEAAHGIKGEA